jgi:hypothetical protein
MSRCQEYKLYPTTAYYRYLRNGNPDHRLLLRVMSTTRGNEVTFSENKVSVSVSLRGSAELERHRHLAIEDMHQDLEICTNICGPNPRWTSCMSVFDSTPQYQVWGRLRHPQVFLFPMMRRHDIRNFGHRRRAPRNFRPGLGRSFRRLPVQDSLGLHRQDPQIER